MISHICSSSKATCSPSSITGYSHRELMLLTHRVKCIGIDISFITFQLIFSIKGTLNLSESSHKRFLLKMTSFFK